MTYWPQAKFRGSERALGLAQRDLPTLKLVVPLCRERRVAVQAGGNLGLYPKRLAEMFELVLTFEPAVDLFPLLVMNAQERNILRYQAALGCKPEMVGLSRVRRDGARAGTVGHEGLTHINGSGQIPTLRLDDFHLPTVDLLCLDVEGWELYALQGAVETIRRCRPVLCVEVNKQLAHVGLTPEQVRGYIRDELGYTFARRLDEGKYKASDEVYVPTEWACAPSS